MKMHPTSIDHIGSTEDIARRIQSEGINIVPTLINQILRDSEKDLQKGYKKLSWLWKELAESLKNTKTWDKIEHKLWTQVGQLRYDAMRKVFQLLDMPPTTLIILKNMWRVSKPHMQAEIDVSPEIQ